MPHLLGPVGNKLVFYVIDSPRFLQSTIWGIKIVSTFFIGVELFLNILYHFLFLQTEPTQHNLFTLHKDRTISVIIHP